MLIPLIVRTYYYSQGTQIYCAPTVDSRAVWQNSMVHIALEGRCFVLSACQFAQEKDYPAGHPVADLHSRDADNVMIGECIAPFAWLVNILDL